MDLKGILKELGMTQTRFAEYIGVDARTVRRWIKEPDVMPYAMKLLVSYIIKDTSGYTVI